MENPLRLLTSVIEAINFFCLFFWNNTIQIIFKIELSQNSFDYFWMCMFEFFRIPSHDKLTGCGRGNSTKNYYHLLQIIWENLSIHFSPQKSLIHLSSLLLFNISCTSPQKGRLYLKRTIRRGLNKSGPFRSTFFKLIPLIFANASRTNQFFSGSLELVVAKWGRYQICFISFSLLTFYFA